jgi:hypothetical protein
MATEEYSVGYEAGYQDGWNKAIDSMAQPPLSAQRKPLTDEQHETLWAAICATGYLTKGQVDGVMEVVESHIGAKP